MNKFIIGEKCFVLDEISPENVLKFIRKEIENGNIQVPNELKSFKLGEHKLYRIMILSLIDSALNK